MINSYVWLLVLLGFLSLSLVIYSSMLIWKQGRNSNLSTLERKLSAQKSYANGLNGSINKDSFGSWKETAVNK